MQEIPGKRANTFRYVHDGYEYHVDTTSVHIYRCATRTTTRCNGAVSVTDDREVLVLRPHTGHARNPTIVEEAHARLEMLRLCQETNMPLKEIFDAVCRRNPLIAPKVTYPSMRNSMQRARAAIRPPIPATLRELGHALDAYAPVAQVYRGMVQGDDGSVALIFASDDMLRAISTSAEIYCDGTFKVAPSNPPIVQLYTIHIRIMDSGVAAVYALCGARTTTLYRAIFNKIIELAPAILNHLKFIMGDFERAAMHAARDAFPEAALHGCWFHFNQALERRWRHLGLSNAPRTILHMTMALPLAPAAKFIEGLGELQVKADEIAAEYPRILEFMTYMRRNWVPLAPVVSVHGCPARTNNLVESFHNEAKRKLGGLHPNIWKFMEHLTEVLVNQDLDLTRLENGLRARRPRRIRDMARDVTIRDAQHELAMERFSLLDFLRRCGNRAADFYPVLQNDLPYEEVEHPAEGLVEPGIMAAGEPGPNLANRPRRRPPARRGRRIAPAAVAVPEPHAAEQRALGAPEEAEWQPPPVFENDDDIFELPEDRAEIFINVPEDLADVENDLPFHPVEAVQRVAPGTGVRPAGTCCVCLAVPATHALTPCGHCCYCSECVNNIDELCPLCRTEFTGNLRIHFDA